MIIVAGCCDPSLPMSIIVPINGQLAVMKDIDPLRANSNLVNNNIVRGIWLWMCLFDLIVEYPLSFALRIHRSDARIILDQRQVLFLVNLVVEYDAIGP